jgi:hypothetical protein
MNNAFQKLVGKALADVTFCQALIKEPARVLKENGVDPTPEMLDALTGLDASAVQKLAAAFGKDQAAS